jgi:hypothetical protein
MAHPLAEQIVERAEAMSIAKATYKICLCVYGVEFYDGRDDTEFELNDMSCADALCLTPVGSHLHIGWEGMAFRVPRSDAAAYQEVVDFVISSWLDKILQHDGALEQLLRAASYGDYTVPTCRIYMENKQGILNRVKDFKYTDISETKQALQQYLAPLRHLAAPLE